MTRTHRLVTAFFCFVAWMSLAADVPRVALYCPVDDAFAQAFVVLAEARLSERKDIWTLDRANLDKTIEEQKLSLSGLVSPETAIKAGRLLKVDLFVALEMVKGARTPYGAVIYDAKLGRRLIDRGLSKGTPEAVAAELTKAIAQAVAKTRDVPENALVLCVMPIRAVGLPDDLDYLPVAVHALLQRALAQSEEIVLLERFYLGLLNDEGPSSVKTLLGSAARLELDFSRGGKEGEARVRVALIAADGKKTLDAAFNVAKPTPDTVTEAILAALDRKFHLKAGALPAFNPKQEAERFHREAQVLQNSGETTAAIAAAEAARAFSNTPEIAATLAGCQLAEAVRLIDEKHSGLLYDDNYLVPRRPEDAERAFKLATKAIAARMDALSPPGKNQTPEQKAYQYFDWRFFKNWTGFNNALLLLAQAAPLNKGRTRDPDTVDRFSARVRAFAFSLDQSPLDIALKKTDDARFLAIFGYYADDIRQKLSMLRFLGRDATCWVAGGHLLLGAFLTTCDRHRDDLYAAYNRLVAKGYCYANDPGYSINRLMAEYFEKVQGASSPMPSLWSDSSALPLWSDPTSPLHKFLDDCRQHPLAIFRVYAAGMNLFAVMEGLDAADTDRARATPRFRDACDRALDAQNATMKQRVPLIETCEAVRESLSIAKNTRWNPGFDPTMEILDLMARRKTICGDKLENYLDKIGNKGRMEEALEKLEMTINAPETRVEAVSAVGQNPILIVQAMARKYGTKAGRTRGNRLTDAWERRRVLVEPENGLLTRAIALDGHYAYLARRRQYETPGSCELCRVNLDNGELEILAHIQNLGVIWLGDSVQRGVVGGGYYFLSLYEVGVFVLDLKTRQVKKFDVTSGLPSNQASEIAWLNGKLYAAFDSEKGGCFAEIDPVSGACRVLGSAGNRGQASPFDNTTKRIKVMAMLACPESNRLLFGVLEMCQANVPWKDEHRSGLYAFDGATGKFTRLSDTRAARISKVCPFNGAYFLRDNHGRAAELYDAVNGARTIYHYGQTKREKNVLPKPNVPGISPGLPSRADMLCPLALIDNYLWTAKPFGRVSLAAGKLECFPESLEDYTSLVLPIDAAGKRVLVSGSCGLVILSP